jgi:hypothetical protein
VLQSPIVVGNDIDISHAGLCRSKLCGVCTYRISRYISKELENEQLYLRNTFVEVHQLQKAVKESATKVKYDDGVEEITGKRKPIKHLVLKCFLMICPRTRKKEVQDS